jgi:hypothetical protein
MGEVLAKQENSIKDFYSHTSRSWNSAVTITIAVIALSVTALFSLGNVSKILSAIFAVSSYIAVVYFGFYRIVELGCQLQFLETYLKVEDATLLEFVSGKKGDEGNVPRLKWTWKRMGVDEAQALKGKMIDFSYFRKHHRLELVLLAILYIGVFIAPIIGPKLPF